MKFQILFNSVLVFCVFCCTPQKESQSNLSLDQSKKFIKEGFCPTSNNIKLYYRFVGNGSDTIVVLHGGPGMDSGYFIADFEGFAKNRTFLFYDQRGGGRSTLPKDTALLHIDRSVEDLELLRKYFGLDKLKLIAHSYGPALAAKYAIVYPENIEKMVFLGPVPPMGADFFPRFAKNTAELLSEEEQQKLLKYQQEMVEGKNVVAACRAFWNIALRPRLAKGVSVEIIKGDCCDASAEAIQYGMRYTNPVTFRSLGNWDFRPALTKLDIPTLIFHGEEEAIPMDMVEEWTKALPKGQLIKVPKAAHFPYVERPDIVWPAIEAFFD